MIWGQFIFIITLLSLLALFYKFGISTLVGFYVEMTRFTQISVQ